MRIMGWAFFCASSWTWCIGMYLPVALIRDFGWPGFAAFAIPNVLGCAAFGYVVATTRASEEMVQRHRTAMRCFSLVAIAYQSYFAAFLATAFLGPAQQAPWLGVLLAGIVVHDGGVLREPVLFAKREIEGIAPATDDSLATDLTAQALGLVLELRFVQPVGLSVVTGRTKTEEQQIRSMLIAPTRPAAVLALAAQRGYPIF